MKFSARFTDNEFVLSKAIALMFALLALAAGLLPAQEYSFRSFGATEGLTNLVIRNIYQDRLLQTRPVPRL